MSKQHRQNAPEPTKASAVVEKPAEQTAVTPEVPSATDAPEPAKASAVDAAGAEPDAAAGSVSELARTDGEIELQCPACIALNGERPCSVECYVAAGYLAENFERHFGAIKDGAATGVELEGVTLPADGVERVVFVPPDGKAHCKALKTCAVRGMPAFAGEEFWFEWHEAKRLEGKGDLEILNKS